MDIVVGILFAIIFYATAVGIAGYVSKPVMKLLDRITSPKYKFFLKIAYDLYFWTGIGMLISLIIYIPIWDWWYNDSPISYAFYLEIFKSD